MDAELKPASPTQSAAPTQPAPPARYYALDALRAFAMLVTPLLHTAGLYMVPASARSALAGTDAAANPPPAVAGAGTGAVHAAADALHDVGRGGCGDDAMAAAAVARLLLRFLRIRLAAARDAAGAGGDRASRLVDAG